MTDEATTNPAVPEYLCFEPLGEVFLAARNAKNLAQKDVSNNLRLSVKQINALENNDFTSLPQPMITRGFIRNYARLLELDVEPLLASYRARVPDDSPVALTVQSSMRQVMSKERSNSWFKYVFGVILALMFFLAWFFYADYAQKPEVKSVEKPKETALATPAPVAIPLPEVALPAAERLAEGAEAPTDAVNSVSSSASSGAVNDAAQTSAVQSVQQITTQPVTQTSQLPKEASVDSNIPKENTARTAQVPVTSQAAPAGQVNAVDATKADAAKNTLKKNNAIESNMIAPTKKGAVAVTKQTWVRVSDKTGAVIYEKMLAANSEDGFDGMPPFKVLIGNASGTTLTFLGKPVDLTSATKNNVVHITLE